MKRIVPIVLSILAVSAGAFAQAPTDPVQKALMAAPARAKKEDVTVIKWKPDFTYDTLQKGASGGLVCYDLAQSPAIHAGVHQYSQPASRRSEFEGRGGGRQEGVRGRINRRGEGRNPREA